MKRFVILVTLLWFAVGAGYAGEPISIGETVTIQSKILGEERTILVSTPPAYDQSSQRYPVLYMTDGGAHLTHTRGTVDFLARLGLMPQVIVVGVNNTDRTRDLTFLDFFEQELFPFVDAQYRTVPLRLFTGHSFGGLFALHALFTRPDMFSAVLSVSPSLNWDEGLPLRQANSFLDGRDELNVTIFVAMADEEEGDPAPTRLDRLEKTLSEADADGFEFAVMRMPDENHGSVVLRAHYWGLRKVFEGWRLPTDPETGRFVGGLDGIKAHFAGLSKKYGVTVMPDEMRVNLIGYQVLGQQEFDEAIAIFRFNVELYPESANVYDSLGEALENAGRLDEAFASYAKAADNAARIGDDRLDIFAANRDRAKALMEDSE
jgi:predicted alpha/beta superfamily hydrolase